MRAVAILLVSAVLAPAADKISNPEYKSWAKFKPGTTVTKKLTDAGTMSTKLVEVKDDKVVIETEYVTKLGGKESKTSSKRDVPKEFDPDRLPPESDATLLKTGKPNGTTEEGKEKVKVGDTEYECVWYKFKRTEMGLTGAQEEVEGQLWVCDDVPGRAVKATFKRKTGTHGSELTDVAIKK